MTPARPQCTLHGTVAGAPLTLSGTGFKPNTSYPINYFLPDGREYGTARATNDKGELADTGYANGGSGTYSVEVLSKGKVVTTCSVVIS